MKKHSIFTSESATAGHPDKLCDQISDAIVDRFLEQDPYSVIRAECAVASGVLFLASRFSSKATVDVAQVARKMISRVGYDREDFNSRTCSILTSIKELAPDASAVFDAEDLTEDEIEGLHVKQQGTFFGYACSQAASLMPLPIWLAHKLAMRIDTVRQQKTLPYLAPDGKTQVSVEYINRKPSRIHTISICTTLIQPERVRALLTLKGDIREAVIEPAFKDEVVRPDDKTRFFLNPEGVLMVGGPAVHSGLTGRKNASDLYGEYSRYSGSALSGKDPLRIDRVGNYAARYAAKNVVAAGLAEECEVQLSYSIGLSRPVSIQVETFETGTIPDTKLLALVKDVFDFRLAAIIKEFDLRNLPARSKGGFYRRLAVYGQVGRMDMELPWERTDKADVLKAG
ncbi:MAG: methionine adenosyltransferase [Syntrophobacteraceae bacterium]|nr:methionine adenosyltransferase [Syntrophobacteraceae bacterium]